MCNLCNGSYVVHEITSFSASFSPCPVCGPMPETEWQQYWSKVQARIEEANPQLKIKGA